ncbi:MAG: hypothetical protein IKK74_04325 [Clostridia bacterium]|nr:hypothetical protein [Clostridia bacterium]
MKLTKIKLTALFAAALCLLLVLSGCSQWELPYEGLNSEGYTVSVRFDPCGGAFANTENVQVVDVFRLADAKKDASGNYQLKLITPDDSRRGDRAFSISKNGCFFAGWYRECSPRTDASGNPLDAYGRPTSESGLEQGYTYSGLWSFESDTLSVPEGNYSSEEPLMTLYAAWIPYFNFEFYVQNESGSFDLYESKQLIELDIPAWDLSTGKLNMNSFPEIDGKTFEGAYLDEAMTKPVTEKLTGDIDYEHGVSATEKICVYTKFAEGEWYRISTAEQFVKNSKLGGCYYIEADLDFTGLNWSAALAGGAFTGKIEGGGHKFSNITFIQADNSKTNGGLFGSLASGASIRGVSFENIKYTLGAGSRMQAPHFGLLCGQLSADAALDSVSVSGSEFIISGDIYPQEYTLGALVGNCDNRGVSLSGISVKLAEGADSQISITSDPASGEIALTFLN